VSADWTAAPEGVDVLLDRSTIKAHFPTLAPDVSTILHIRRAGDISGQQLGQYMLEAVRAAGGKVRRARVTAIEPGQPFTLHLEGDASTVRLLADRVVNAAGPHFSEIAALLGDEMPLSYVYQQKIAFEDREGAVPRTLPFLIDLDGQHLDWSEEERLELASDPETAVLLQAMPGGIHCRPEGNEGGRWIKLGWAYNTTQSNPAGDPPLDPNFPDVVLRGAGRLQPALRTYLGRLPRGARHYGGYYAMTAENWPLIGPTRKGAFMAGALSGFGTMAATATGALCAAWMQGEQVPSYARSLSLERYADELLMSQLRSSASRGVL
jgi:glycine/D-amino acid oxidase-like deaminating enzyme